MNSPRTPASDLRAIAKWNKAHPEYNRQKKHEWRKRNREKNAAHCKVYRATKKGILVRPEACDRCGKECRPQASHDDYSKPLEVEWLCQPCHSQKDYDARKVVT